MQLQQCATPHARPLGTQRLMRDFKRLQQDPPQGVNGSPNPDNIMLWNAVIFGPEDTPWDGGERRCRLVGCGLQPTPCTAEIGAFVIQAHSG